MSDEEEEDTPEPTGSIKGHVAIVVLLANNNADIHRTSGLGVSALTLACAGQHREVIRLLKIFNAAVNPIQKMIAPTPFMAACFNNDIEICAFLTQHGCNVNQKVDALNLDARTFTIKCGFNFVLNFIDDFKVEPPVQKDLATAIQEGNIVDCTYLLQNITINSSLSSEGVTPLMYCAVMSRLEIAEMIIENKCCHIDSQENVLGMTALMFAIVAGDNEMVCLLLKLGAKVSICSTTKEAFTAIDLSQHACELTQDTLLLLYRHYLKIPSSLLDVEKPTKVVATLTHHALLPSPSFSHDKFSANKTLKKCCCPLDAHIDWTESLPFRLAEEILRGDNKYKNGNVRLLPKPHDFINLARNLVLRWINQGDSLNQFPIGVTISGGESSEFVSIAQRNAYGCFANAEEPPSSLYNFPPCSEPIFSYSQPTTKIADFGISSKAAATIQKSNNQSRNLVRNAPHRPNSESQVANSLTSVQHGHQRAAGISHTLNAENLGLASSQSFGFKSSITPSGTPQPSRNLISLMKPSSFSKSSNSVESLQNCPSTMLSSSSEVLRSHHFVKKGNTNSPRSIHRGPRPFTKS
uniref:Uncharacterized protein n=1 Tax=Ditylenchus dipsaci TaxID=166011 RepID=A0A915DJZ1_9BILA